MGDDELAGGSQLNETKFTPPILPCNDEGLTDIKDKEKFSSAKSSHSSFDFQSPPIDRETPLCVIQQLQATNSKLKSSNQKLKVFFAVLTLSSLCILGIMGCFLYLHFDINAKLDTIQPIFDTKACDDCKMQLSFQAKLLANLSLQIDAISQSPQRYTDTYNSSEVKPFSFTNWASQPKLNWD